MLFEPSTLGFKPRSLEYQDSKGFLGESQETLYLVQKFNFTLRLLHFTLQVSKVLSGFVSHLARSQIGWARSRSSVWR